MSDTKNASGGLINSAPPAPRTAMLTAEEKAAALSWFNSKMAQHSAGCSMCGTKSWNLLEHFVSPNSYTPGGGVMLGGVQYPHFMLVCSNCGNTQFINAILAGIVPKDST